MLSRRMSLPKMLTSSTPPDHGGDDQQKECAIKVVIRARPLSDRELLAKTPVVVNVTRTSVQVINPIVFLDPTYLEAVSSPTKRATQSNLPIALTAQGISAAVTAGECRAFHFDRCFGVDNAAANDTEPFANSYDIDFSTQRPNQELIFDEIGREMIESAFQGFNCTVLAYGQTGSGKTHTMVGEKTTKGKGLIPRVCEALFAAIEARRSKEGDEEASGEEEEKDMKKTIYSTEVSTLAGSTSPTRAVNVGKVPNPTILSPGKLLRDLQRKSERSIGRAISWCVSCIGEIAATRSTTVVAIQRRRFWELSEDAESSRASHHGAVRRRVEFSTSSLVCRHCGRNAGW